jgi:histidinol-phosphate aminotransferase
MVRRVLDERERVFRGLAGIPGIRPVPSSANFILFGTGGLPASVFFERLRARGVLVRVFADSLLAGHLRVTIGKPVENDAFLAAARAVACGDAS